VCKSMPTNFINPPKIEIKKRKENRYTSKRLYGVMMVSGPFPKRRYGTGCYSLARGQ